MVILCACGIHILLSIRNANRVPYLARQLSDCYAGQSTRGVLGGTVSGWGSQDQ